MNNNKCCKVNFKLKSPSFDREYEKLNDTFISATRIIGVIKLEKGEALPKTFAKGNNS